MLNDKADYYSEIKSITVNGKNAYELGGLLTQSDYPIQKLCEAHELPMCNVRKFEMIKYSFGQDKEYVAVKEDEYDDLARTSNDACRTYQEIFRMMNEGWMVTRAKYREAEYKSNLKTSM
uniref:Uncharacterized protein n=1 Tax=Tanacetum cinerariifolium TaxID=118510 RepID=A0A699LBI6_TANCI|nr:hypothetical protein [Tanacetum cinerariifolium]